MMRSLWRWAWRDGVHHWRRSLWLWAWITAAVALMAGIMLAVDGLMVQHAAASLAVQPAAQRNLRVLSGDPTIDPNAYAPLPGFHEETVEVTYGVLPEPVDLLMIEGAETAVSLWAFGERWTGLQLLAGQFPQPDKREAAITQEVALRTGLEVGDVIGGVAITAIVQPEDLHESRWFGEWPAFDVQTSISSDGNTVTIPLLVLPPLVNQFAEQPFNEWRLLVDEDALAQLVGRSSGTALYLAQRLERIRTEQRAELHTMQTGLPDWLRQQAAQFSAARQTMHLILAQAGLLFLWLVAVVGQRLWDGMREETAVWQARGGSRRQISGMWAVQVGVLALLAILPGVWLARTVVVLWLDTSPRLMVELWQVAGGTAVIGWLLLVVPVWLGLRRRGTAKLPWRAEPARRPIWHRWFVDVILIVLGGVIVWRWSLLGVQTSAGDGWMLLSPFVFSVGVVLFGLRLFPWAMRLLSWVARRRSGWVWAVRMADMAERPFAEMTIVAWISVIIVLLIVGSGVRSGVQAQLAVMGHYAAGADMRVALDNLATNERDSGESAAYHAAHIRDLSGVTAVSPVIRFSLQVDEGTLQETTLLAIEPGTLPTVARYPDGMSPYSLAQVTVVLQQQMDDTVLPAVFSQEAVPSGKTVGDTVSFLLPGRTRHLVTLQIAGIVVDFPTVNGRFVLIDLPQLRQFLPPETMQLLTGREGWLNVANGQMEAVKTGLAGRVLADQPASKAALAVDGLAQAMIDGWRLTMRLLLMVGMVGFSLLFGHTPALARMENYIWFLLGTGRSQMVRSWVVRGGLLLVVGVVWGTAVGWLMVQLISRNFW